MRRMNIAVMCLLAGGGLGLAMIVSTAFGATDIPIAHLLGILARVVGVPAEPRWQPWEATVVIDVRLPRVLVGVCVGGGLALCGGALQGLFRNPLADPGVLGVSAGASLGAVIALYLGLAAYTVWALPLLACCGAGLAAFVVYAMATRRGHMPVSTLLLAGVAMNSLATALTSFLLSLALANYTIGQQIMLWLLGGLDGRTWEHVKLVAPVTLLGAAAIVMYARDLDALLLGELHAVSVGVDVPRVRRRLIIATSVVTGVGVAVSGIIAFVGLIIPHLLRRLIGPQHQGLLPLSMVVGAAFVVLADCVARVLIAPEEVRLGVITATLGAPFFLFILSHNRREGVL